MLELDAAMKHEAFIYKSLLGKIDIEPAVTSEGLINNAAYFCTGKH